MAPYGIHHKMCRNSDGLAWPSLGDELVRGPQMLQEVVSQGQVERNYTVAGNCADQTMGYGAQSLRWEAVYWNSDEQVVGHFEVVQLVAVGTARFFVYNSLPVRKPQAF